MANRTLHKEADSVARAILGRNPGRLTYPRSLSGKEIFTVRRMLRGRYSQGSLEERIQFEVGENETIIFIGRR